MRAQFRFWLALSLLLVAGVLILRWKERSMIPSRGAGHATTSARASKAPELLTTPEAISTYLAERGQGQQEFEPATNRARYQLSNVKDDIQAMVKRDSAVLMANALIDTREAINLKIPAHLKAGENPGAFIAQMRSGVKATEFLKMLREAGAEVAAYVPNNAYLVKASAEVAEKVRASVLAEATLPYEPYYKIHSRLMKFAVAQEPIDGDAWVRVTLFSGGSAESLRGLARQMGPTESSPFGEQVLMQPLTDALPDLARMAEVQLIEPVNRRIQANDLTRVRMGVDPSQTNAGPYLGLTGGNIWMNLNDIGVDSTHPDLTGRVFYNGTNGNVDIDGHGTHVAATLIGNGGTNAFDLFNQVKTNIHAGRITTNNGETYVDGSRLNASMKGLAPDAKLFVLAVATGPERNKAVTDSYLIETAARTNYFTLARSNTLISVNPWTYANTVDYDSQAARYDAATRDAVKDAEFSQPVLYVFAAGNNGSGDEDGNGGEPGRITSPGTAKNVITVGALETPRFITEGLTNIVVTTEGTNSVTNTNVVQIFLPTTDSETEVASFSSRGNTGIGLEGEYGRFKPDLVAPGTFILSAKSAQWNLTNDFPPTGTANQSNLFLVISNVNSVSTRYRYDSGTSFSTPGVGGVLALVQEFFAEKLPSGLRRNLSPALLKALMINSARNVHPQYDFEVQNVINYQGWGLASITNVVNTNMLTKPEREWPVQMVDQTPTNSLATGETVSWRVGFTTNSQASPLRISLVWTDPPGNPVVATKLVNDLDLVVEAGGTLWHGNDFLSGRRFTEGRDREASLIGTPGGQVFGDSGYRDSINNVENIYIPGGLGTNITIHVIGRRVNVKAINDSELLDEIRQDFALVVSSDYRGLDQNDNPIAPFTEFEKLGFQDFDFKTQSVMTNGLPLLNQRVGANGPLMGTNGVAAQWNFYVFTNNNSNVNGLHLENAGEYVAFVTFTPPNLSVPRNLEADIDLFVSKDPRLTNLNPAVLNSAWRSVQRGGTEQVIFAPTDAITNQLGAVVDRAPLYPAENGVITGQSGLNEVFYIAVKSEDQQAAEFSLIGVSSERPFEQDRNGVRVLRVMPSSAFIPDGLPNRPRAATGIAIGISNRRTLDASVFMTLSHEEMGDLVGTLRHNATRAILNNHFLGFLGTNSFIFTDDFYLNRSLPPDITQFPYPGLTANNIWYSDGPGILAGFAGTKPAGAWMFEMIDNAFSHTGRVELAEVHLKPVGDLALNGTINGTVAAGGQQFYALDVPPNARKVTLTLKQTSNLGTPLQMYVSKDVVPTTNQGEFEYRGIITPPADSTTITIDRTTAPPLTPGTYFVAIVNPGTAAANFSLTTLMDFDDAGANITQIGATNVIIRDDALTASVRTVTNDFTVASVAVQLLATDILESSIVFTLVSPQGTRVILSENRGGLDRNGFGSSAVTTNANTNVFRGPSYAVFTDDPSARLPIKFVPPPFGDSSTNRGPVTGNGFEGTPPGNYSAPQTFDGWTVDSNMVSVVAGNAHSGQNYFNSLRRGSISRVLPTIPGRTYELRLAYRGTPAIDRTFAAASTNWIGLPRSGPIFGTGRSIDTNSRHTNAPVGQVDPHYTILSSPSVLLTNWIVSTNSPAFANWFANDTNSQWIAPSPDGMTNLSGGPLFTNRTTFVISENAANLRIDGRAAADGGIMDIRVNGVSTGISYFGSTNYSPPFVLTGPFSLGTNTIDFVVTNNSGLPALRTDLSASFVGGPLNTNEGALANSIGFVKISANTTNLFSLTGGADWKTFATEFVALDATTDLQLFSGDLRGIDIDSIQLIDTGTVFLKPEEPLAILEGERAMGEWTLEAVDNRTGVPWKIDEWNLLLGRAPAFYPAEKLARGATYPLVINDAAARAATNFMTPGLLKRGEVHWFYFDVCPDATSATIQFFPVNNPTNRGGMQILVDRSGFPTGNPDTDDYAVLTAPDNNAVRLTLTTTSPAWAPLRPGTRMFIGVRNVSFFTTNQYRLNYFDNGQCGFVPPPVLAFNVSVENTASSAAFSDGGDEYQLNSPSSASLEVEVLEPGQLTILASRNVSPTPNQFEVRQVISGKGTIALANGGNWRIRVVNESLQDIDYRLLATEPSAGVTILNTSVNANGRFQVTWQSTAQRQYEIAVTTDLNTQSWTPLETVTATGTVTTFTDPASASGTQKYYRIRPL